MLLKKRQTKPSELEKMISPTTLLIVLLLLPLYLLLKIALNRSSLALPPSPSKLPIIGNLHQLGSLPHRSLSKLSNKFGPLMSLRLGSIPALVVSSAEAAGEVMSTHDLVFASRPSLKVAKVMIYNSEDLAFSPYGEHWRQMRKICATHLLSKKMVNSFGTIRKEEVGLMIEKIFSMGSQVVDMSDVLYSFSNDLMCRVVSGTDTSYTVLEWTLTELIRHPKVMKKLKIELLKKTNGKSSIDENDLNQMIYLKAVLKETLRLHPPATILSPRESIKECRIQGYDIPRKTRVIINAWKICRDPKNWEAADEFRPERFVDSLIDFRGNDFQFIPFGAGRRICPGINFSVSTMELALANLVHKFNWELPTGMRREELDMEETSGLITHKKQGLKLLVKPILNFNEED